MYNSQLVNYLVTDNYGSTLEQIMLDAEYGLSEEGAYTLGYNLV